MAFTDPSDFDEVLREGDEYLSKIEEELGNEGRKQVLSRIEKGFAKTKMGNNKLPFTTTYEVPLETTFSSCTQGSE